MQEPAIPRQASAPLREPLQRPGESPREALQRHRGAAAEAKAKDRSKWLGLSTPRIGYLPHVGSRQRLKGLRQLARARGVPIMACARCGTLARLDSLQDAADGRLCCVPCLEAEMRDDGQGEAAAG
jgi:hypothetical protein